MSPSKTWLLRLAGLGVALGILLGILSEGGKSCPIPLFHRASAAGSLVTPASEAPASGSAAAWRARWTHSLTKLRQEPSALGPLSESPIRVEMARNEYESFQLVLIGESQSRRVRVSVGDLLHENQKASFPSDVVEIRRVHYVQTVKPDYPTAYVGAWPDALPHAEYIDVPANTVQPVWITIGAPDALLPGVYAGPVTLIDDQGHIEEMQIQVTVWDFSLPPRGHLATAFDFYRNRMEKAYREFVFNGQLWEGKFDLLQQLYYLDMLKHRLSPILNANPFGGSFGDTHALYQGLGLTAFAIGDFGGNQGPTGNDWPSDPIAFASAMEWYTEAAHILRTEGLLQDAYVYAFDEPKANDTRVIQVLQALKDASLDLPTLVVMHEPVDPSTHGQWLKNADILCQRITSFDPEKAQAWAALGKTMWMYISSPVEGYPSLAIDEPAMHHRILPWLCWKVKAQGLLYWCVNFWEGDPSDNPASFAKDQNGNGFLYYPAPEGPIPSIRLEVLRDGLEDYEYLALLDEALADAEARGNLDTALRDQAKALLAIDDQIARSLKSYGTSPDALMRARRAIAELIVKLQAPQPGSLP